MVLICLIHFSHLSLVSLSSYLKRIRARTELMAYSICSHKMLQRLVRLIINKPINMVQKSVYRDRSFRFYLVHVLLLSLRIYPKQQQYLVRRIYDRYLRLRLRYRRRCIIQLGVTSLNWCEVKGWDVFFLFLHRLR